MKRKQPNGYAALRMRYEIVGNQPFGLQKGDTKVWVTSISGPEEQPTHGKEDKKL